MKVLICVVAGVMAVVKCRRSRGEYSDLVVYTHMTIFGRCCHCEKVAQSRLSFYHGEYNKIKETKEINESRFDSLIMLALTLNYIP